MGLFSSKKIISVASTVYNLAGEEKDRPNVLRSTIVRNVLSGTKQSMAASINNAYLNGSGIKYRSFFRWALLNYDLIGMPTGSMYAGDTINVLLIEELMPREPGTGVWVQNAFLGGADFENWADQWMLDNYPDEFTTEWECSFNRDTLEVTVKRVGGSTHTFVADNFEPDELYIYIQYISSIELEEEPIEIGSEVFLPPGTPFPPIDDFLLTSDNTVNRTETLTQTTTVVKSYSDGRPDETTSTALPSDFVVEKRTQVYNKIEYISSIDIDAKRAKITYRNLFTDKIISVMTSTSTVSEDIGGGVTMTTTTTYVTDTLIDNNSYRDDIDYRNEYIYDPLKIYIYKLGSGIPEFDALRSQTADFGKFFPAIPIRYENEFIEEIPEQDDVYELSKTAFRKATGGGSYDELIDNLKDTDKLDDMDYIYSVFGVSLNAIDNSCRKYIYLFFNRLALPNTSAISFEDYQAQVDAYNAAFLLWAQWRVEYGDDPYAPNQPPYLPPYPVLPNNEITISTIGDNETSSLRYDMRIYWNFIVEIFEDGKAKPTAKKGNYWIEYVGEEAVLDYVYDAESLTGYSFNARNVSIIHIYHQYEDDKYSYIKIYGLRHRNYVYGGESVEIGAKEALTDAEESGFIVPLHYATFREMSLIDSTQMATASQFIVINSYKITKQKWYEKGIFKIIFVIIIAIVSVVFTGGAGLGILGTALSVGTALGFTGLTAAIVGSIANALAALVLVTILQKLTEDLGIIGIIITTIVTIALSGGIDAFVNGGFANTFNTFLRPENLLKLADAASQGYAQIVQDNIMDMQQELTDLYESTNAQLKKMRESYAELFGMGGGEIDPLMFTNTLIPIESRDAYLARTLMTGNDVADMSHGMINNYADLTLKLPDAFT